MEIGTLHSIAYEALQPAAVKMLKTISEIQGVDFDEFKTEEVVNIMVHCTRQFNRIGDVISCAVLNKQYANKKAH